MVLGREADAALLEAAISKALGRCRTGGIATPGLARASTATMGQAVLDALGGADLAACPFPAGRVAGAAAATYHRRRVLLPTGDRP